MPAFIQPSDATPEEPERNAQQVYLDALKAEREYYANFGFEDRVPDVDAEIARVTGNAEPRKRPSSRAETTTSSAKLEKA